MNTNGGTHIKLIPFENTATQKIRFSIVRLNTALQTVENEIAEFYHQMYAFDREYQRRLGDLAESVLALRIELGLHERKALKPPPVITHLVDEQLQQLKSAYRQAAKLCHPDYLPQKHKQQGLDYFDALNKAYHLQDIVTVEHIFWLLQTGQAFHQHPLVITNYDLLIKQKELLIDIIAQKKDHLEQLRMHEEYDISNRDNWNIIMYDYQTQLEDELALLRGRARVHRKKSDKNSDNNLV